MIWYIWNEKLSCFLWQLIFGFMSSLRHLTSRKGYIQFQVLKKRLKNYPKFTTCPSSRMCPGSPLIDFRYWLAKIISLFFNSMHRSRQNAIKEHTIEWIEKHYPGLFQEIHFGNHFALDGQSRPKSDICKYILVNSSFFSFQILLTPTHVWPFLEYITIFFN